MSSQVRTMLRGAQSLEAWLSKRNGRGVSFMNGTWTADEPPYETTVTALTPRGLLQKLAKRRGEQGGSK